MELQQQQHIIDEDLALRKILEGTSAHTGKDFFKALVKNLAEALNTKGAWVTEFLPELGRVRALAFWYDDRFVDHYEFDIEGTPCQWVFEKKRLYHIPENILKLFPDDPDLRSMSASSYLGMPLFDLDGSILGNLAVLDNRPMPDEARNKTLFKIFADRAASELRRLSAENQLRERTKQLQKEYRRKSEELEDARRMQLNMLPQEIPTHPDYQFAFCMRTATEVGGDYYDYQLSEDRTLTFGIGDATGHGLQASVMVTAIKLLFSEHAAQTEIIEFLNRASHSLSLMDFRKIYMAFAMGRLTGNILELAGAGMPPALIYRAKTGSLEQMELKGMPLGTKISFPYTKVSTQIEPDDVVVLLTDGLHELFNAEGEMLGFERVGNLVMEAVQQHPTPREIIDRLYRAAEDWLEGSSQDDDMTFFVFKRTASAD